MGRYARGGTVGLMLDARGRPLALPKAADKRAEALLEWQTRLGGG